MVPTAMAAARRPLLRRMLAVNVLLAISLAAVLFALALWALSDSAQRAARTDIAAELRALARRYAELRIVSFAAEIEHRTHEQAGDGDDQSVYLLLRSDGSKVAGNLARWPAAQPIRAGQFQFDGGDAGLNPGRIVAEALVVDGHFPLLVGRRIASVDTLVRRLLPAALLLLSTFVGLTAWLTLRTDRHYRARIAATNAVFDRLQRGDVRQRVAEDIVAAGDELASLGANINRALAEIERLVKGLDAFSQSAAHELNRELSRLRDEARASGSPHFAAATEQLIELLSQVLALARIEASPGFASQPIEVTAVVGAALEVYLDAAAMADVALESDFAGAHGATLRGVEELLRSALMNLVENALKHAPGGSRVRVAAHADANTITIEVADQGPGTDSEDLSELIARGSTGPVHGHGFGLRLVQAVALRHGATVRLRNTHPGLSVSLRFPRA